MKKALVLAFLITILITPTVVSAQSYGGGLEGLRGIFEGISQLLSRLSSDDQTAQLGGIVAPSPLINLKLLSPNGGETFYLGGTIPIRWTTLSTYNPTTVAHFYLINARGEYVRNLGSALLNKGIATSLIVPSTLPTGSYKVAIGASNATSPSTPLSGFDSSDGAFAIKSPATSGPTAEFTLLSKLTTTSGVPQVNSRTNQSTSTLLAIFQVRMKAVGGDIIFGGPASTTALFANDDPVWSVNGLHSFVNYFNGLATTSLSNSVATIITNYAVPLGNGVISNGNNTFTLINGSSVDITVNHLFAGRMGIPSVPLMSGNYSVGLERINWISGGIKSTRYPGDTMWRTNSVSFP